MFLKFLFQGGECNAESPSFPFLTLNTQSTALLPWQPTYFPRLLFQGGEGNAEKKESLLYPSCPLNNPLTWTISELNFVSKWAALSASMLSSNDFIRSWYCYRQMTKIPTVFLKDHDWSSPSDSLLLHCHKLHLKGMDRLSLKFSKVQGKNVLLILLRSGGTTSSVNKGCLSRGS